MKRSLIFTLLAVVVIGAALPYAPVDFLKTPIERALARGLGRKVEVDQVSLTLFSGPGVSLDGVTIHEDSRAGIEPFAYANTLDARISLLALLRGRLEFSSLDLNDATFNLVKPAGAAWNFQMLLSQTSAAASTSSLPVAANPVAPVVIPSTLPAIKMRGGRVNFKFAQTKSVLYFDDTDLEVAPGDRGAVELRFSGVPSRTDQGAQNFGHFYVRGNATPSASGQQFNFQVEMEPSALDAVARLFDNGTAALKGLVSLEAQVSGSPATLDVKGTLLLQNAGEWRVGYKGKLDLAAQTLELDSISPPGLNTKLHASTRDLLTTPQWEVSADFNDAPLGSGVELARNLGAPLTAKMTIEGVVAGSVRYRNIEGLGGNLEVRDASVSMSGAAPLKIPTATVFLKGNSVVAGPNTVNVGDTDSADVEGTYQAGEGGGVEIKIATHRMNVADLHALSALGVGTIPLLDRITDGTWRGNLSYANPDSLANKGTWSGDFEIQNTRLNVDGLADPVRVQSAAVSAKDQTVAVTRIRAKVGGIAFGGEYHWAAEAAEEDTDSDAERPRPQSFRLQVTAADAKEVERLFQPTISREGGLLARTLRLGAAGTIPDWLTERNVEGILSIGTLTLADTRLSIDNARLLWDGASLKLAAIRGKVADAALTGELSVDLAGRAPGYRFEGNLDGLAYRGGRLDFKGKISAEGTGPALWASIKADGALSGRSIAFSPDAEFRRASGRFQMNMTATGPRWKLSGLKLTQGSDNYSGEGSTQADGRLLLDLSSSGRQVTYQ
jgi:AsmA family